jgi:5-methylcytosine-specific restriction endonuclease McrA
MGMRKASSLIEIVRSRPNWVQAFYESRAWFNARRQALIAAGWQCQRSHGGCGASVAGKGRAIVDHIRPLRTHPALALEPANLRVLCPACHNRRHGRDRAQPQAQGARLDGWPASPDHPWNAKAGDNHG